MGSSSFSSSSRATHGPEDMAPSERSTSAWERYAWIAGILFVVALVADVVVAIGIPVNQHDSAAKIANALHDHRDQQLVITCLSVI
jgi:hypothetical protein